MFEMAPTEPARLTPEEISQVYKQWEQFVRDKFPRMHSEPYCVPPLHFNKLAFQKKLEINLPENAKVLHEDQDSNIRNDQVHRHLVSVFFSMAKHLGEVMFIMSSVQFDNYLYKPLTLEKTSGAQERESGAKKQVDRKHTKKKSKQSTTPSKENRRLGSMNNQILQQPEKLADGGNQISVQSEAKHKVTPIKNLKNKNSVNPVIDFDSQQDLLPASDDKSQDHGEPRDDNSQQTRSDTSTGASYLPQTVPRKHVVGKARLFFKSPEQLSTEFKRGDFDILIVHPVYGFVVMEIKAAGDMTEILNLDESRQREIVIKKFHQVVSQLNKCEKFLRHALSDNEDVPSNKPIHLFENEDVNLTKVIAMPNMPRDFLRSTLQQCDPKLHEELFLCLGTRSIEEVLTACLCADDVPKISSECTVMATVTSWWKRLLNGKFTKTMTATTYEQLVSRFCGKHSMVEVWSWGKPKAEVRTISEAVNETGRRFCWLLIHPVQMEILSSCIPRLFITGPPGSGKTLLLLLKGVQWVREGYDVFILTGGNRGLSVSLILHTQIVETLHDKELVNKVHKIFVTPDKSPQEVVEQMISIPGKAGFCILVDEGWKPMSSQHFEPILLTILDIFMLVHSCVSEMLTLGSKHRRETYSCQAFQAVPDCSNFSANVEGLRESVQEIKTCVSRMTKAQTFVKDVLSEQVESLLTQIFNHFLVDTVSSFCEIIPFSTESFIKVMTPVVHDLKSYLHEVRMVLSSLYAWVTSVVFREVITQASHHTECHGSWAAGVWEGACPDGFELKKLSTIVRSPPAVQQLLSMVEKDASHTLIRRYDYLNTSTDVNPPLPTDGPPPLFIAHSVASGCYQSSGNSRPCVFQCYNCGAKLARHLTENLKIASGTKKDASLTFSDVIVIGNEAKCTENSPFVKALVDYHVPVDVIVTVKGKEEVASRVLNSKELVISDTFYIHGLEKKVVVYVPDIKLTDEADEGDFCRVNCGIDPKNRSANHDCGGENSASGSDYNINIGDVDKKKINVCIFETQDQFKICAEGKTPTLETPTGLPRMLERCCSLESAPDWLASMGTANRQMLWYVASRTLSHVVIFHFGNDQ